MKVLMVDEKTGTEYIKEVDFDLPLYAIGEKVGYPHPKTEGMYMESTITNIEMSAFKQDDKIYQAYAYQLKNGDFVTEDEIEYGDV